jgi:hypothetical protein
MMGINKGGKMKLVFDSSQHLYIRHVDAINPDIPTNKKKLN